MQEPVPIRLAAGALFHARYRVVRRIKSGGMGTVYEVVDTRLGRHRALKVMLPEMVDDPALFARFELEGKATAQVHSEHVVETIDSGVDPETGAPFLVMELLDGEDLDAVLARRGPLPPGDVVAWLRQVAMGLDRIHAASVVHRDLKPANLFLTLRDDGSPCIKVLDFGVAKKIVRAAEGPQTTRIMGTPAYMSPEQIRGDGSIGPRADLYALGHIAFTLLVGTAYWSREESDGGMWLLAGKVVLGLPERATARSRALGVPLPAAFDPWFDRATALAPEGRFATASELVEPLAAILAAAPPLLRASAVTEGSPACSPLASTAPALFPLPGAALSTPERPRPRRGPVLAAGALLLSGMVTIGISLLARRAPSSASPASTSPPDLRAPPPPGSSAPAAPAATHADALASEPAVREPALPGKVGGIARAGGSIGTTPGSPLRAPRGRGVAMEASPPSPISTPPTPPPSTVSMGVPAAPAKSAPAPPPYDPADQP